MLKLYTVRKSRTEWEVERAGTILAIPGSIVPAGRSRVQDVRSGAWGEKDNLPGNVKRVGEPADMTGAPE